MIKKTLSNKAISQRTDEQAFMWNLYHYIEYKGLSKTRKLIEATILQTINRYYTPNDTYSKVIDEIRYKLLKDAGIKKPIIKDTSLWKKIKESLKNESK